MPATVGGPGGSLVSGRDFSLAQNDKPRQSANDAATKISPSKRSRLRAGSDEVPLGLVLGSAAGIGSDPELGLVTGGVGSAGSKRALHNPGP